LTSLIHHIQPGSSPSPALLEDPVTNRELLNAPRESLSPVERQKQFILRVQRTPSSCPACRELVDALTASGLDVDRFEFGVETPPFRCPHCSAVLEQVVPLVAAGSLWHWQVNHDWLKDMLHKARLHEKSHSEGKQ
jgi:hypothetical protein